jgi:predicted Fe-Mo cluster-binding NifX family protein
MKILVTSTGETLESLVDSRFGRAAKFILFDTVTGQYESIDNARSMNAPQGAGIQAAETVARLGPQCVITGHCGPKAFRVLSAAGIMIFNTDAINVAEALEKFRSGRLVQARSADVEGHWA